MRRNQLNVYKLTMKNFRGEAEIAANDEDAARRLIRKLFPAVKVKNLQFDRELKKKKKK